MPLLNKDLFAALSVFITLSAYAPYFYSIFRGTCRPHAFSWLIWFVLTFIAFLVQYAGGAGAGAWPTLLVSMICLAVSAAGFRTGKKDIHRSDYIALGAAFLTIPLWYLTKDPLWSVIIVTLIDAIGFFPTFRKAYSMPQAERAVTYFMLGISNTLTALAMERASFANVLFPAYLAAMNMTLVIFLIWRRRAGRVSGTARQTTAG